MFFRINKIVSSIFGESLPLSLSLSLSLSLFLSVFSNIYLGVILSYSNSIDLSGNKCQEIFKNNIRLTFSSTLMPFKSRKECKTTLGPTNPSPPFTMRTIESFSLFRTCTVPSFLPSFYSLENTREAFVAPTLRGVIS